MTSSQIEKAPSTTAPSSETREQWSEATLRRRIADLEEELLQTRCELDSIRQSTIWRASLVLRAPVMMLLRLRHLVRQAPGEIARRGGWYPQMCEWWREFRAYGWGYFKRIGIYEFNPGPGSGENDRNDYSAWKQRFGTAHPNSLRLLPHATPATSPLLSVVIPVYRPPLHLLKAAIDSVQAQTYTHWEICIADDASGDDELRGYLQSLAARNSNVHVCFREKNGHISACSNSALSLASGEFIVLLDQDDILPPHALQRVVDCIAQHPDAGIIFSDEDRIDETGHKTLGSYFKPDFNYDLFLGHNLISHLGVYRRSLVEEIGGFRLGLEGSQDWDLALRALERLRPDQVVHIPEVLYHWRAIEGSTALAQSEKSYTTTASRRAIEEHLGRLGIAAEVLASTHMPAFNRVRYNLDPQHRTATLVLTFDYPPDRLRKIVRCLVAQKGAIDCDVIIAAAGAAEAGAAAVEDWGGVPVRRIPVARDTSPAERLNAALAHAHGHFLGAITIPLIEVSGGWLEELCRIAGQSRVGFTAPRIIDSAGLEDIFDHGGVLFTDDMRAVHAHKGLFTDMTGYAGRAILQQSFKALSPAVLVARRSLLEGPTPFTRDFGGRLDLVDKCLEFHQRGLDNVWTPEVDVRFNDLRHAGRANLLTELGPFGAQRRAWIAKWGRQPRDPAYNPNLSPDGDFALNWRDPS